MLWIDTIGRGKERAEANQDHVEDDSNDNDDDDNYDNKEDNDDRDICDFNVNDAGRRLKYSGKTREGARNRSLMKERVE